MRRRGHCSIEPDAKKSDQYILYLSQAGLGLPDRDYYWDAKYKEKLAAYGRTSQRMLTLCEGRRCPGAAAEIVAFETRIAKAQWSKDDNRDNIKTYNKKTRAELVGSRPASTGSCTSTRSAPRPPRSSSFAAVVLHGHGENGRLGAAGDLEGVAEVESDPRTTRACSNQELVDADFAFYGTTLRGVPENRPRWKRAVGAVEGSLGEAVGKLYVDGISRPRPSCGWTRWSRTSSRPIARASENLDWMRPETKQKAMAKLATFNPKIGYPKKWRDYSSLEIRRDDLVGNLQRATAFEWNRDLARLDKPVDRDEWYMTPQTVNAYYNPSMNEIVFPAAILQPPFFNRPPTTR